MLTYLLLRLFHIAFAAVWWGASLPISRDIRYTLNRADLQFEPLIYRTGRARLFGMGSGLATIVTGLLLISTIGGFGRVPSAILIGLGLAAVLLFSEFFVFGAVWKKLVTCLNAESVNSAQAKHLARRLTYIGGTHHGLWVVVLCLMIFRHYQS